MTVMAQDVFTTAMNLMEEESEDGTYAGYPEEYKKRAWPILTMLQAELTPASISVTTIINSDSLFQLDDRTCLTVFPYGLAAHLLMNEDQNRAAFFNARYDELKRKRPAVISPIKDVYTPTEEPSTPDTGETDGGTFGFDSPGVWDGGEF
jgi:hypothetical protein